MIINILHGWYNQSHFGSFKNIGTSVYTRVQNMQELEEMRANPITGNIA